MGSVPGAAIICSYTGELAVHGWDLATATAQQLVIDDELLVGAMAAASSIPAEGRGTPEIPFGPVVDPGPVAPLLDRLPAGWVAT